MNLNRFKRNRLNKTCASLTHSVYCNNPLSNSKINGDVSEWEISKINKMKCILMMRSACRFLKRKSMFVFLTSGNKTFKFFSMNFLTKHSKKGIFLCESKNRIINGRTKTILRTTKVNRPYSLIHKYSFSKNFGHAKGKNTSILFTRMTRNQKTTYLWKKGSSIFSSCQK